MKSITISTSSRTQLVDITDAVQKLVSASKISGGLCHIWVPHTTAGLTVNENADPSVARDLLDSLNRLVPFQAGYAHSEGNSAAHIKSTLVGCEKSLSIEDGRLALGNWQGIFLCEFDGPRKRQVWVRIMSS